MANSPTSLTLRLLRKAGFMCEVVEKWLPIKGKKIRRDLFKIGDVLGVNPRSKTFLLVQTTSISNVSARIAKAKAEPRLATWLAAGGLFEVHGWVRRAGAWRVRRVPLSGPDMKAVPVVTVPRKDRKGVQRGLFDE